MTLLWIPMIIQVAANGGAATPAPQSDLAEETPEVVVAGSRLPMWAEDLGVNVTVLKRVDFDAEKPAQLADVLRNVAGLHIDQVGGRGGTGSLYLRGADPNYTLVMVDGVRVNDPTNARGGSFDFSTFDVDDVERIEVARGPYSALFGGDALAGVVNIVTRKRESRRLHASLDAMAGAYDTHEIALRAGGGFAAGGWSLGASDSNEGEVVRGNHFDSRRVSGALETEIAEGKFHIQLNGRYAESERAGFPDDSGGYQFADIRDTEHRDAHEAVFGAGVSSFTGNGKLALTLGYFDRGETVDSPGVAPGIRDPFGVPASVVSSDISRFAATFTGNTDFSGVVLAYGAEYQREQGTSDGSLDFGGGFVIPTSFDLTRTSWAPFAEIQMGGASGASFQAGVRVDNPEDHSSVTSPRARLAYGFDAGRSGTFTVAGAWGKGFKLPSLYALGHPLVGNPDLVPERSESWEVQLSQDYGYGTAHWSLTWFQSEFRNAIDFDSGPPPMLVNRDRVDSEGFELAGSMKAGDDWKLDASVTQAKSRIASTGGELRNRPEWRAGAGAHWSPQESLTFTAAVTYVGTTFDSSIPTGDVHLPSYTLVDLSASWQVSKKLEAYLAIDNLTDEQYQQFVGFEVRGIAPRAGVRFSF
jgi:outer membrane cobalamin receptor